MTIRQIYRGVLSCNRHSIVGIPFFQRRSNRCITRIPKANNVLPWHWGLVYVLFVQPYLQLVWRRKSGGVIPPGLVLFSPPVMAQCTWDCETMTDCRYTWVNAVTGVADTAPICQPCAQKIWDKLPVHTKETWTRWLL